MEKHDYTPRIRQLVRRFSLNVAKERPNDTLSQALGEVVSRETIEEQQQQENPESWQTWLQVRKPYNDSDMRDLEERKEGMAKRWKEFNSSLKIGVISTEGDGPPRVNTLLQAVGAAEEAWARRKESGLGKTKSAVENFLNTLNDHSYLFSVIPNGDKYTSLITGVITSVVKASVNSKKMAELFSEALEEIAESLQTVNKSVKISDSSQMKRLVVELYIGVFDFLCHALEWYESSLKRFKSAFNQNSVNNINQKVSVIKRTLGRIQLEADQVTQCRVQDTQQSITKVWQGVSQLLEEAGKRTRQYENLKTVIMDLDYRFQALGQMAKQLLLAEGEATVYDQRISRATTFEKGGRKSQVSERMKSASGDIATTYREVPFTYTRDEIREKAAPCLDALLQGGTSEDLKTSTNANTKILLPEEVRKRIGKWVRDPSSSFLWVESPVYAPAEQQLSLMALQICDLALRARDPLPCILFTPYLLHFNTTSETDMSKQEKVLIILLYHIVDQLIYLLPEELDSTIGEFNKLDGKSTSATTALDIIGALLAYTPPTFMVIIDKLQLAECPTTMPYLEQLIDLFKNHAQNQMIKAMFITGGSSKVLAKVLNCRTEKVYARRMVQAKPGQPLRGWSSLSGWNFLQRQHR